LKIDKMKQHSAKPTKIGYIQVIRHLCKKQTK
jgi:hypothetical protein